jgi:tetratricopeptide (TPR) repeat protein
MLAAATSVAWAAGGGPMEIQSPPRQESPQDKAKELYNRGIGDVKKADKYQASFAQLTDAGKKEKASREAQEYYSSALKKFDQATQNDPDLYEAWNYFAYTNRHLGNYDAALTAYERALKLHPGYPEALEYRGEAYLGLNRVSDAKQAYMDLFSSNRVLADKLLVSMKDWLQAQRAASGADPQMVSDMDKWIQERASIAGQTASLTREGTAAAWN